MAGAERDSFGSNPQEDRPSAPNRLATPGSAHCTARSAFAWQQAIISPLATLKSTSRRLRACWVTQAPSGLAITPTRWTWRLVFEEEQHSEPPQPDRVDGEAVARHGPGRLPAQERLPLGDYSPRRRSSPLRRNVVRIGVTDTYTLGRSNAPLIRWSPQD
jgi:hypothetical protein